MGFSNSDVTQIWRVLAGILCLGNVGFDGSTLSDSTPCSVKDVVELELSADFFGVSRNELAMCMTTVKRKIGSSVIVSPKKLDESVASRDAISRAMYERLFGKIVD